MKWFKKLISPKKIFPEARHIVKFSFTIGGVDYYEFEDLNNVPYERALTSLIFFRELDLNCDNDFLIKHTEAVDKLLKSNPIDIFRIKQVNDLLAQRAKLPKDTELLYKIASVVFFDKNESPLVYDYAYGARKIEHWKKHSGTLESFFLQQPLIKLIPYLEHIGDNLTTFSQMTEKTKNQHSALVLDILSKS